MAQRRKRRTVVGRVEKHCNELVVDLAVHYSCVKLADRNKWVKLMNRKGRPRGMGAAWKEKRPEGR